MNINTRVEGLFASYLTGISNGESYQMSVDSVCCMCVHI